MSVNCTILKDAKFRSFFISDIISGFGVGMATIGANWFVLMKTGSNKYVGILLAVNVIAGFVASLFSGVITDKYNRKVVIFLTHSIRAFFLLLLFVVLANFDFSMYYLYAFAIINGVGWTIYMSASRSFLQEILDEKKYITGNSLLEISLQVGMFLAAAASGFIYKYFDFNTIILVNALMFILSAITIYFIKYSSAKVESTTENYFQMLSRGWGFLYDNKAIFILGVVSIIPLIVTMIYNVVLPDYVNNTLGKDSVTFGLADMSYGLGGLLSGVMMSSLAIKLDTKRLIGIFFIIACANLFFLSRNTIVFNLYLFSLLLGLCNSSLRILMNSVLMKTVPGDYMGRSMAVWIGISLISQCIFSLFIGSYLDKHGATVGILIMSLIMGVGFILFVLNQLLIAKKNHEKLQE
ncbi:MFS transporter [Prodigiosinella confusarubida]|uniref:MFS transporter n=1 Tax=Serratia sp. (strain ATCC 39006) TaxID=104623 RepID=A0A2I5T5Z4_SERS3|nr:MFS transporter [Serratia sp. ATCC 39006]AUG99984.1 MFS transporter [Serratia sp. ATCC 39006]AUH04304.1 MFS transporter [Serratia sp. ATCC 39006]